MKKIWECPCDHCPRRAKCGREALECKAVKHYYDTGWYQPQQVAVKLKPMRMRTK